LLQTAIVTCTVYTINELKNGVIIYNFINKRELAPNTSAKCHYLYTYERG